jgi:lipopolysaccharide/colanic/teichoic acid biosynthesis glycosyltransferase
VLKFRSMRVNPDGDTQWSVVEDHRVTRLGSVLRRTSLDELPQLINVVRGDMSLVGPRPERPHFVRRFDSEVHRYSDRHRVPVGLTGLAQVNGLRGDTSIEDRVRFDNHYIENWTLLTDVSIVVRSVGAVVRDAIRGPRHRKHGTVVDLTDGRITSLAGATPPDLASPLRNGSHPDVPPNSKSPVGPNGSSRHAEEQTSTKR